jgi:sterol desaturase/sphingolipid hydroxylase (fatty acid hydroxylase superfamily)
VGQPAALGRDIALDLLLAFTIVAVLAFAAERLAPERPQPILRRGFATDCAYVAVNVVLRVVFTNTLAVLLVALGRRLFPDAAIGLLSTAPLWLQSVAVIVVLDFCFYWMHRAKHRWRWWWRLHETHHSSRDLDWLSSVRFHPLEKILDRVLYLLPLLVLGVGEQALLVLAVVDAAVATFAHANLRVRLGPLNYVLVTPELHRWHHATDGAAQATNFGNNLSVFDWIFGTARLVRERPPAFGLEGPYPDEGFAAQFLWAFRREAPTPASIALPASDTAG